MDGLAPSGLQADFYLLVLAAVYHADGLWGEATFDLIPRGMPADVGYLVAGGIEEAVDQALGLRFTEEEIGWMRSQEVFSRASEGWWDTLRLLEFTGDIHAVPEGTVVFPGEPVLRVTAPLKQATLLETKIVRAVRHATAVASRAARICRTVPDRRVYEFASRRAPDGGSALATARAAIVGGVFATSNAEAGFRLKVPVVGTLSSSFMAAYGDDARALEAFGIHFPDVGFVNLPRGTAEDAVAQLAPYKEHLKIVRVEAVDLVGTSVRVRAALDAHGMEHVHILGSGSLNEVRLAALAEAEAPVPLVAVGKHLADALPLGFDYRLAEIWRGPSPEPALHPGASRLPGAKQVVRFAERDLIALSRETTELEMAGGRALLQPYVLGGERVREPELPQVGRARLNRELGQLPAGIQDRPPSSDWPVEVSARLSELAMG